MQPPHSEPIQPQQDNTLKQCMKLLACFHGSIKHAEEDIKQVCMCVRTNVHNASVSTYIRTYNY